MRGDVYPGLVHRPALEFSYADLADAFNLCFEGYVMPVNVGAAGLEGRLRPEDTDLAASRVYLQDGRVAGIVFVGRRGRTSRVGALGVAGGSRGAGLGTRVMRDVISEARARRDERMVLEVIERNAPAVDLYRRLGFETARRLVGYRRAAATGDGEWPEELDEIEPAEFSRVVAAEGERNLPWMLDPETLSAYALPSRAYALSGRAFALVSGVSPEQATLVAAVVTRRFRNRGWGRRIVRALFAAHPGRAWSVVQIVPEDLAPGFFEKLGFEREGPTQLEMRLAL